MLLGDRDVVEAVLRKLLEAPYQDGVIVDGFPRTQVQAECILMLHEMMKQLRQEFSTDTQNYHKFRCGARAHGARAARDDPRRQATPLSCRGALCGRVREYQAAARTRQGCAGVQQASRGDGRWKADTCVLSSRGRGAVVSPMVRAQVRSTDVSEDLAKGRYRAFKEEVYAALTTVKSKLPFHFIPAGARVRRLADATVA